MENKTKNKKIRVVKEDEDSITFEIPEKYFSKEKQTKPKMKGGKK